MTVPAPTFGPTGFIVPQESDILAAVLADINLAFGGGLNTSLSTPQGQLATSMTAVIGSVNDTFLKYTQQVDPAYADGRMQDGIARIYFLERKPPLPTVVQALCVGAQGTVIPIGSLAQATDDNLYTCTQAGTIGASGSVTLTFECVTPGAISCAAGNLNSIYQTILGWDSIVNPADGVIGQDVESRRDFETRRFDSVANNSLGFLNAILGAVWELDNVIDAYVTENFTASPLTVQGVVLAPHSLYVAVVGGDADEIAKAIWTKKAPGCAMNGSTTITVYDDVSGYDPPLPSYTISFQIPDPLETLFSVSIVSNSQVPSDADVQIQNAIVSAFSGGDGGPRIRIGSTVYASRFYAPVAALGSWVQIIAIDVGSTNYPTATITGSIGGTTLTVTGTLSGGLIAVGQFLSGSSSGSDITPGTQIVSQLSGSAGGTGTYSISISQTLPSSTIKLSVPTLNSVASQIDQQPVTSPPIIVVTAT